MVRLPYWWVAVAPLVGIAVYYLLWKYAVGFLNREVGIAG